MGGPSQGYHVIYEVKGFFIYIIFIIQLSKVRSLRSLLQERTLSPCVSMSLCTWEEDVIHPKLGNKKGTKKKGITL